MKKIALITGASSGIGRQIAVDLSNEGFKCLLLGRDLSKLNAVQLECENSDIYQVHLDQSQSIKRFITDFYSNYKEVLGSTFVLVNNAGIVIRESFESADLESWHQQFHTNLFGPVQLTKGLIPFLKQQKAAKIINISSTLGLRPIKDTSAYSASKSAMNNWTQSLALELSKDKITVNAICPGIVETPLQSFYQTQDQNLRNILNQMQPLGRVGTAKDISSLVTYLSSDQCEWMTGSILPIDGGISLG